jgi:hypothetical protein
MKRVSIFLITVALIMGVVGCGPTPVQYTLSISSTQGGTVTTPGEGTRTYDADTVVNLVATKDAGYRFVNWTGDVDTIANVNAASTTITMNDNYSISANFQAIPPAQYSLTICSTAGGSVTTPGQGTFTYDAGTVVGLVAEAEEGYEFAGWTGDVGSIADINAASTNITMDGHYSITADFAIAICDWYELDAIRENLGGSYILMNDLDSTTAGYTELASRTANQGKGWQPIGSIIERPITLLPAQPVGPFAGTFDGRQYEIEDLFINFPDEDGVGLFGSVDEGGVIQNLALVDAEVTGHDYVGCVVGWNGGTVSVSRSSGSTGGASNVGGLVGGNGGLGGPSGTVNNSYSIGSVTANWQVGGLVGWNFGTVSNCYASASVSGQSTVGGLIGDNRGSVTNCYSSGSVTGSQFVGGLVGTTQGTLTNSYYSYDELLINGRKVITLGALFGADFRQWLASNMFLDINKQLSQDKGYYLINDVNDFKQLLAFGQDSSLKFRLTTNMDLATEPSLYIPYLAGEFDGDGHKIWNLSFSSDFVSNVGLVGYLAPGGKVSEVGVENVNITGAENVGGAVGSNYGTVSDSYSTGTVTGLYRQAGGLVGFNRGTVINCYSTASVTGGRNCLGGLVGWNEGGTVKNSYYDYDEVLISGEKIIAVGALCAQDFEQWLANDKSLDVNERLSQQNGYYLINNVGDFKQLLAFGQDSSLKFRLTTDLDLSNEPNFYIPYLAGEFDGDGHKISNLSFNFDFVSNVGLVGHLAPGGKVSEVGVENVNITGDLCVGGGVGWNDGTVSGSYSTGSLTGAVFVGGLVGVNRGTVSRCYSTSRATGTLGGGCVGGLVGRMYNGTVTNSYSTGGATGPSCVGGLVGHNWGGSVSNSYSTASVSGNVLVGGFVGENEGTVTGSFWDMQTSGQATSAGGTGKTIAEMKSIATFSGAGWNIIVVADPGRRNLSYVWNIVDGQTYPFLSWEL